MYDCFKKSIIQFHMQNLLSVNTIKTIYYFLIKRNLYFLRKKILNNFRNEFNKNNNYYENLKEEGYVIIKNFISKNDCKIIINDIENFIEKYPNLTWKDKNRSDIRIFGSEKISNKIFKYFDDNMCRQIGNCYYKGELKNLMTMANKTIFVENNEGSGQGWHRDGLNFQYKSILYLVDVNENNGPFELIKKSQKDLNILKSCLKFNLNPFNTRISNEIVNKIISKSNYNCLKTITGEAGDLILVDTSLIHRGRPLKNNKRLALTNYYYPKHLINRYKNAFAPMLKDNFF